MTENSVPPRPGNPRFSMRALVGATVAFAVLYTAFHRLGMTPFASFFVTALIVFSLVAGFALVLLLAKAASRDDGDPG